MSLNVVLFEPEIPQNTGNIARTCAATGAKLHLIKPLGFSLDDKYMKRAGLDYWPYVQIEYHDSFEQFLEQYRAAYPKAAKDIKFEDAVKALNEQKIDVPESLKDVDKMTLQQLKDYDWPGNIKQLQSVIEGMVRHSRNEHQLESETSFVLIDAIGRHEPRPTNIQRGAGNGIFRIVPSGETILAVVFEKRLQERCAELFERTVGAVTITNVSASPKALSTIEMRSEEPRKITERRNCPSHKFPVHGFCVCRNDMKRKLGIELGIEHICNLPQSQSVAMRKPDDAQSAFNLTAGRVKTVQDEHGKTGVCNFQELEDIEQQRSIVAVARTHILKFNDKRVDVVQV